MIHTGLLYFQLTVFENYLKKVLFYNSSMNNFTQFGQNGNTFEPFEHQKNIIFGGKISNDFFFFVIFKQCVTSFVGKSSDLLPKSTKL